MMTMRTLAEGEAEAPQTRQASPESLAVASPRVGVTFPFVHGSFMFELYDEPVLALSAKACSLAEATSS